MYVAPMRSPVRLRSDTAAGHRFHSGGDPVTVKLDPFSFIEHRFGEGKVRGSAKAHSPPDTTAPIPRNTYYKGQDRFYEYQAAQCTSSFRLIPGMTLTGDIHIEHDRYSCTCWLARSGGVGEAMREP